MGAKRKPTGPPPESSRDGRTGRTQGSGSSTFQQERASSSTEIPQTENQQETHEETETDGLETALKGFGAGITDAIKCLESVGEAATNASKFLASVGDGVSNASKSLGDGMGYWPAVMNQSLSTGKAMTLVTEVGAYIDEQATGIVQRLDSKVDNVTASVSRLDRRVASVERRTLEQREESNTAKSDLRNDSDRLFKEMDVLKRINHGSLVKRKTLEAAMDQIDWPLNHLNQVLPDAQRMTLHDLLKSEDPRIPLNLVFYNLPTAGASVDQQRTLMTFLKL